MTRPRTPSAPLGRDAGRYLLPGEKAVVNQRRHWAALVRPGVRGVPVLVAELFDGERSVNLVWVGRRRIAGIEPGVFLVAEGRIAKVKGVPTIFNPNYQIVPAK